MVVDPYVPCDVHGRAADQHKIRSSTVMSPQSVETKVIETEAIEPEDLEPRRIELGRNLGTDPVSDTGKMCEKFYY